MRYGNKEKESNKKKEDGRKKENRIHKENEKNKNENSNMIILNQRQELSNNKEIILRYMIQKSGIDDFSLKIYLRFDGKLEYLGFSPAGTLILNYLSLNQLKRERRIEDSGRTPNNNINLKNGSNNNESIERNIMIYNNSHNFNILRIKEILNKLVNKNRILFMENQYFKLQYINLCINHYFYNFCILYPIIDEQFLNEHPDPLLIKIVATIGARYIGHSSKIDEEVYENIVNELLNLITIEFNQRFLKPSLIVTICISLILQFKIKLKLKFIWILFNMNSIYSNLLGLNYLPFNSRKFNRRERRLRFNLYLSIFIQDKLKIFLLNRNSSIICGDWKLNYPSFSKDLENIRLPLSNPTQSQFILVRDTLSSLYSITLAKLCDLIGYHDLLEKKYTITQDKQEIYNKIEKMIQLNQSIFKNYNQQLLKITYNQPNWVMDLNQPLMIFLILVKESIILNLILPYLKYYDNNKNNKTPKNEKNFRKYYELAYISSELIINSLANEQSHQFLISYSTYSFYAISLACLTLNYLRKYADGIRGMDKEKETENGNRMKGVSIEELVENGVMFLKKYQKFSPIVKEFLNQIEFL
ncbi:hypothetical protein K502DRAFT_326348, partial [Neoconidiobolus thromboides FSU 785]